MTDTPKPVLTFSMDNLSKDDIAKLDTNYGDVTNAIPTDLMNAFVANKLTLTASATIHILCGSQQWLLNDGAHYYEMRVDGTKLDVYSITEAMFSVLLTKAKTATGVLSIMIITNACQAVLNTQLSLPKGMTKPDWFDPLVGHLDDAKALATEWINDLAPDLTASLPNKVINYDTQYQAITAQIDKIATANPQAKGANDPNVKNVFALITALKGEVGTIHDEIVAEDAKLQAWGTKMQAAHDKLAGGVYSIQSAETALQSEIGKLNADIERLHSLIDGENKAIAAAAAAIGIGIFAAIVGVALCFIPGMQVVGGVVAAGGVLAVAGGATTWGIMQHKINEQYDEIKKDQDKLTVDQQQLVALRGLEMATTQSVNSISTAVSALSSVRAMWKLFAGELQGVLDQLNDANKDLALIVNEAFVNGAANEWKLAAEFAQQLLAQPAVTPKKEKLPMDVTPEKQAA